MQHTAAHCSTLQHTATHCNTLQNTLQYSRLTRSAETIGSTHCNTMQHTATHCSTLQHITTHCNTTQHSRLTRSTEMIGRGRPPGRGGFFPPPPNHRDIALPRRGNHFFRHFGAPGALSRSRSSSVGLRRGGRSERNRPPRHSTAIGTVFLFCVVGVCFGVLGGTCLGMFWGG